MILSEKWVLSHAVVSILIGASLFMYGFFPLSFTSSERADSGDLPDYIDDIPLNKSIYRRHVTRTVLMVIDAMRTDFIQNQQNTSMKYLNKMINDDLACMINLNVEVPTVTMPRIKAMTTGTIPNFIDVVLNLGSSELHMDSVLHQVYDNGGKMVFCGDNTWGKMFPEMFHRKLENQDSLYVNDFYEGDKNITKKLSVELKRNDWELLILHFLGLDHIGHVEGPFSNKVPTKLREMDTVAMHIQLALQHWKQSTEEQTLFIITGDHGMRDSGGHGGSSYAEVNVPLIFIGPNYSRTKESYNQIDMPATLSVLFGLPIPASSIGVTIPHLLTDLSAEQKLYAYYYNAERLLQKLVNLETGHSFEDKEFYNQLLDAKKAHKTFIHINKNDPQNTNGMAEAFVEAERGYIAASKEISDTLADSYVNFDLISIVAATICLLTTLTYVALSFLSNTTRVDISSKYTVVLCSISSVAHQNLLGHTLIQPNALSLPLTAMIYFVILSNIQIIASLAQNINITQFWQLWHSTRALPKFLMFGVVFHAISLASSSFIEEEHQIWNYLNNTVWVLLYTMETKHFLKLKSSKKVTNETAQQFIESQIGWILLFFGHLVARRLNQTGDKWLNVPDIGDWLQMEENRTWNSFFVCASLLFMYLTCMEFGSILTNVLTITACMLVYYYRTLIGSVYFAGIKPSELTGTSITLFWLNLGEIAAINYVPILYNTLRSKLKRFDIKLIFGTLVVLVALVVALTHKPHNVFLIPLLLFSCSKIKQTCTNIAEDATKSTNLLVQCVLHMWIGKQFFFYQGNSNSLASIDLNAGYVGLSTFNFAAVGLFLTLNTFSGPILSLLAFVHNSYDCNEKIKQKTDDKYVLPLCVLLVALPFTIYVFIILLMRQHIFIWSVFSPKLLYEYYYLCLMYLMLVFVRLTPKLE